MESTHTIHATQTTPHAARPDPRPPDDPTQRHGEYVLQRFEELAGEERTMDFQGFILAVFESQRQQQNKSKAWDVLAGAAKQGSTQGLERLGMDVNEAPSWFRNFEDVMVRVGWHRSTLAARHSSLC